MKPIYRFALFLSVLVMLISLLGLTVPPPETNAGNTQSELMQGTLQDPLQTETFLAQKLVGRRNGSLGSFGNRPRG